MRAILAFNGLKREEMEFRLEPPTAALENMKSVFEVEKLQIELLDILNKQQVRNCASIYTNQGLKIFQYVCVHTKRIT